MIGPCLCGDICCPSCGPAQGNSRCLVCGAWASDGCDDPAKCEAEMPAAVERERLATEAEAAQIIEMDRLAKEYDWGAE